MPGPFDDAGQLPFDPIVPPPDNPGVAPKPVQQAVKDIGSAVGGAAEGALEIPKRFYGASEGLRQTGEYDPSAMYDAALLLAGGGMGGAEKGALGAIGGAMASRKANLSNLLKAKFMEIDGAAPDAIWKATGWQRDVAGDWQYEISDAAVNLKNRYGKRVRDVIDHPTLFEHYPDVGDIEVRHLSPIGGGYYTNPIYGADKEHISIHPEDQYASEYSQGSTLSNLMHEIHHAIAHREGFQQGANERSHDLISAVSRGLADKFFPFEKRKRLQELEEKQLSAPLTGKDRHDLEELYFDQSSAQLKIEKLYPKTIYKTYRHHAGEVGARNVQSRLERAKLLQELSPSEKRLYLSKFLNDKGERGITEQEYLNRPLEFTEDVPRSQQIVRRRPELGEKHIPIRSNNPSVVGLSQVNSSYNIDDYTDNPQHYDYESAKSAGFKPDSRGHWPDTYKLPSHITFSDESQYNDGGAGHWEKMKDGKWSFTPGPTNLKYHSMNELRSYFKKYEPDSVLIEPKQDAPKQRIYNPLTDS